MYVKCLYLFVSRIYIYQALNKETNQQAGKGNKGKMEQIEKVGKEQTNLTLRKTIKIRVKGAIRHGYFPDSPSMSKLFEKLVSAEMNRRNVPQEFDD